MNPTRNPVTGDFMITGHATDAYKDGWERIFGKKAEAQEPIPEVDLEQSEPDYPEISVKEFAGRRVFTVDVGDLPAEKAVQLIEHIREYFNR